MPSLDSIKRMVEKLKQEVANLIFSSQAPMLIVLQAGETRDEAIQRVCGAEGLPTVMFNGRPVPHLFVRGVVPTRAPTEEGE
jgi:hypothetical protein